MRLLVQVLQALALVTASRPGPVPVRTRAWTLYQAKHAGEELLVAEDGTAFCNAAASDGAPILQLWGTATLRQHGCTKAVERLKPQALHPLLTWAALERSPQELMQALRAAFDAVCAQQVASEGGGEQNVLQVHCHTGT